MWRQRRRERFYGVVPKLSQLDGLREKVSETEEEVLVPWEPLKWPWSEDEMAKVNAEHFAEHVATCHKRTTV